MIIVTTSVALGGIMFRKGKLRLALTIGLVTAAASLGLIVPTLSGAAAPHGTITIAEGPGANPNYIFPYYSGQYCSVANINLMEPVFRPLYWFGLGNSAALQPKISTGFLPRYSNGNKTVTIKMKGWKFADGQTVNAESVMFFLNMAKAVPSDFCTYSPGLGIPDQIANATGHGNIVTLHMKTAVSPRWFTDNELAIITPMANAWDRTSGSQTAKCASGKFNAASTKVACTNVYNFLNKQGANISTFTKKMWTSGTDGPWRLTKMDDLGNATFVPNKHYSGPQKAQTANFKLVAFTSATAEENQLQAGAIDVGFVDPSILTSDAPSPGKAGANWGQLASRYNLVTGQTFSENDMDLNFGKNPGSVFINQLYVRQALQSSIDQAAIVKNAFKNYAEPSFSALPLSTPASEVGKITAPYAFNLATAETDLTSNGWTKKSGSLVCTSPGTGSGDCGAGITNGEALTLAVQWSSGSPSEDTEMAAIVADWQSLGITVNQSQATFDNVIFNCTSEYNPSTTQDICNWGGGWLYAPDYYPSGEPLYLTGASSNYGNYSSPTMDSLIKATLTTNINLNAYAKYTASNLPDLWDPVNLGTSEIIKTLHSSIGFKDVLETLTPEYFHY
ncbi:MAG TPA: ABC transporter substrate-binding protein [Acidimicrobiales bacterium]|nr:ABC transporter substrate-binding protein [Acidimicrobiales bacterium]